MTGQSTLPNQEAVVTQESLMSTAPPLRFTIALRNGARRNMPEVPDVGAITQQVKARIKQVEDELKQREKLADELERLRAALHGLEGEARRRISGVRPNRKRKDSASIPAGPRTRAPRGQNKAKVLDAFKDGRPLTASEVASATGISSGTVSTLLTKLTKSGELTKADRGYRLPE
jgi:CRP-like cAMP-binding protein